MSRCICCDVRLNDLDFKACKEICSDCQDIIDESLAEFDSTWDKESKFEYISEGIQEKCQDLDFYDTLGD